MPNITFVLNNQILVLTKIYLSLHTGYIFTKAPFTFLISVWTSFKAPPSIITRLPRYGKI